MTTDKDHILERGFAQLRAQEIVPSEALLDRIMLDADQVLAAHGVVAAPAFAAPQGFATALLDAIGGWMSVGGLTVAAMAGLWIGVYPPDAVYDFSTGFLGDTFEIPVLESDVFAGLEG